MAGELNRKVVVVSGGANDLGCEMVELFVERGGPATPTEWQI